MKITIRKTHTFIELSVDETKTTVFKSNTNELEGMIHNLLDVADDLAGYTQKSFAEYVREAGISRKIP
jgi:hypothetical protein